MSADPPGKSQALIQQAILLRAKCRVSFARVGPIHIGFHPANRNGEPPSAERCLSLLKDILGQGFDPNEADCNAVLVQEAPGSVSINHFNAKACDGNDQLAPSVGGIAVTYGSLSHSHLNQVFKNIMAGLRLDVPKITSPSTGRLDIALLELIDPAFARYCRDGLMWDILSHKIIDEVPDGLNIIQAACNCKHAVAMLPHEMEAIAGLSRMCIKSSAVADNLSFQVAKDKLALTLPGMADDPDFMSLFRFVVDLGGGSAPFIPDLREFTGRLVNPQAMLEQINQLSNYSLIH